MNLHQIMMIVVLCIFYIAYFTKMFHQKKKGITTSVLGKGNKDKRTLLVEQVLRFSTSIILPVELISIALNTRGFQSKTFTSTGIVLACLGVFIFIIAMVTMRDSWRAGIPENQKTTLVKKGIYRLSRNPAFLGFDLMYIGTFIAFANIVHFTFFLLAVGMMHLQILEEEKYLYSVFGEEYMIYKKDTARYFIFF